MLIDSHCHLTDERLVPEAEAIIADLGKDGLESVVTVGYDRESSLGGLELAQRHPSVFCTLGVHPHDADKLDEDMLAEMKDLASHPKVVGIGEIGLDYYYDLSPRDVQRDAFVRQLALADECGLPACLHVRDAYGDCLEILTANAGLLSHGVLLHCYSGSPEMVREFSRFDAYFAFGGAITFKNARRNIEALSAVPADRLLLETDCPYMTPVPYRGHTNYPRLVSLVADKAAEVLGVSREEVERMTTENTKRLFYRMKTSL